MNIYRDINIFCTVVVVVGGRTAPASPLVPPLDPKMGENKHYLSLLIVYRNGHPKETVTI
jgi:hypothetical protein